MPFVNIKVAGPTLTPNQIGQLQEGATRLMAGPMRKKAELTAVLVEQVPVAGWSIGGAPARVAAHLDVKITAGTNTEEEKARFLEEASGLLKAVLGADALPTATYVVIHEVAADAWGYDGRSQDQRRRAAAPL